MTALLLFGLYPQAYYPQLSINATCVPSNEMGIVDGMGNRFTDTRHIEGTLSDMLDEALAFVRKNMRVATKIDTATGKRIDIPQYPMDAVREAILNALVHRDYSFHTEGMPIQLIMYTDRMEIINPGGLYGRLTIDQLGNVQPDTRNPVLVTAMETLKKTENRYSGIPTIRYAMKKLSLPEPVFVDSRGKFTVTLYNTNTTTEVVPAEATTVQYEDEKGLVEFCRVSRTRAEIVEHLAIPSGQYALRRYLDPLVQAKIILMTNPEKPRSPNQKYYTAPNI
jgi:ATP-dependent DNA helicase RecG